MKLCKALVAMGLAGAMALPAFADRGWSNDEFISADDCTNIDYEDAVRFVDEHFLPALGYLPAADDVEEQFFKVYVLSSAVTLRSQMCLAESLELKELTDQLKQEQALIQSGTSFGRNEILKQRELSEAADAQIRAASEQIEELSPEQRKTMTVGIATYLAGAYATSEMLQTVDEVAIKAGEDAKNSADNLKDLANDPGKALGGLFKKKNKSKSRNGIHNAAKVVTFFTELLPGVKDQVVRLFDTGTYLTQFSSMHAMELPADATDKLSGVMDWE